ncbi:tRNA1(Val) (adenine(37)-N6)-methyltransferase [Apilactobacillus sp. TMW 2.2459]|uniref:tRNA1(Val) (adenine(37)-N6)-methyltransferase n=1 Tax=Apilactobacillus xinyiensis TaxID=2841032 RepID=UPI00200C6056|nr:tRNA1(Val) (adenine(37)-N6)-methyltransferase [Apilactobacillus xinyiensis]MCL0311606.1 tRNA1(Val) (adenine(37)-N6)-methyltransferase [Apilactobacillus xinyiensis]
MNINLNENERIDQLYSNDVKIIQNPEVFSFSLDAVLLAYFTKIPLKKIKLVDLCAGNGAVGLFLAHKVNGIIDSVELQPKLADMAKRSVTLNDLDNKLTVIQDNLLNSFKHIKKDSVDIITCNPPYFPNLVSSKKNPNKHLAIARHEITTNLDDIMGISAGLLKTNGKAFFVYRPDRLTELFLKMSEHGIIPKQVQFVYPRINKNANIVLVEGIKSGKIGGLKALPPITVYDENNEYSPLIREMLYGK